MKIKDWSLFARQGNDALKIPDDYFDKINLKINSKAAKFFASLCFHANEKGELPSPKILLQKIKTPRSTFYFYLSILIKKNLLVNSSDKILDKNLDSPTICPTKILDKILDNLDKILDKNLEILTQLKKLISLQMPVNIKFEDDEQEKNPQKNLGQKLGQLGQKLGQSKKLSNKNLGQLGQKLGQNLGQNFENCKPINNHDTPQTPANTSFASDGQEKNHEKNLGQNLGQSNNLSNNLIDENENEKEKEKKEKKKRKEPKENKEKKIKEKEKIYLSQEKNFCTSSEKISSDVSVDHANAVTTALAPATKIIAQEFEKFWTAYPRKVGKQAALTKYIVKRKKYPNLCELVLNALSWQTKQPQWADPLYIPHPTTYLNQERYLDEPIVTSTLSPILQTEQEKQNAKNKIQNLYNEITKAAQTHTHNTLTTSTTPNPTIDNIKKLILQKKSQQKNLLTQLNQILKPIIDQHPSIYEYANDLVDFVDRLKDNCLIDDTLAKQLQVITQSEKNLQDEIFRLILIYQKLENNEELDTYDLDNFFEIFRDT